jgi:cell pole-organizing protein PopZ
MSAANVTTPSASLEEERRAQEPSMEEILASIRRIIADDDKLPPARKLGERRRHEEDAEVAHPGPALQPPEDWSHEPPAPSNDMHPVHVADEDEDEEIAAQLESEGGEDDPHAEQLVDAFESAHRDAYRREAPDHLDADAYALDAHAFAAQGDGAPLISPNASASVGAHFQALAASMIINDSGILQEYAKEMLRPMLKQWLDDNLPVMVERLVRVEIERVARGGRR